MRARKITFHIINAYFVRNNFSRNTIKEKWTKLERIDPQNKTRSPRSFFVTTDGVTLLSRVYVDTCAFV